VCPLFLGVPARIDGGLVGRNSTIERIKKSLLEDSDVAVYSGLPGVGKTALANAIAHDKSINEKFGGNVCWLSVGRCGPEHLSHWVHRLAPWAFALKIRPEQIDAATFSEDGAKLSHLITAALADRSMLLIFDDVWEMGDAQIFKSIGANCGRLITTRSVTIASNFVTAAPCAVSVGEVSASGAMSLMERFVPDAEEYGDRIGKVLTLVGGVPFLIIIVAKTLREKQLTLGRQAAERYLDELIAKRDVLDLPAEERLPQDQMTVMREGQSRTYKAIIELTTEGFKTREKSALTALSAFPPKSNTFSREAGIAVAGEESSLETLCASGLLEWSDPAPPRFTIQRLSMHQAIADFAKQAREGEAEAYQRMAGYFIDYVAEAGQQQSPDEWVESLVPEAENIRTLLVWLVQGGEKLLGLQLMTSLWPFWYERGLHRRGRAIAEQFLAMPGALPKTRDASLLLAQIQHDAGVYAFRMADLDRAQQLQELAYKSHEELGEHALISHNLNYLALIHRERGDYGEAMTLLLEALDRSRRADDLDWQARHLNNLGTVEFRFGRYSDAVSYHSESLKLFESINHAWGSAMATIDLAEAYVALKRNCDAAELLRTKLAERHKAGDDKSAGTALRVWGESILAGRSPNARPVFVFLASISLSASVSDALGTGQSLEGLVAACKEEGENKLGALAAGSLCAYLERSSVVVPQCRLGRWEESLRVLRQRLGSEFDVSFEEGHGPVISRRELSPHAGIESCLNRDVETTVRLLLDHDDDVGQGVGR
jgi:tetratricopeptide (TPR) repeat protein